MKTPETAQALWPGPACGELWISDPRVMDHHSELSALDTKRCIAAPRPNVRQGNRRPVLGPARGCGRVKGDRGLWEGVVK